MTIRIDFSRMMAPAVASGVTEAEWRELGGRYASAWTAIERGAAEGRFGFRELERQADEHARVLTFADAVRGRYDDVVVLGIGGSALGTIALRTALLPTDWNALPPGARGGRPRLHVLDNVDPRTVVARLDAVSLPRTLFLVVSKSGGTAETMAQYLIARGRLETAGLDVRSHVAFVTDPERGALRPIATAEGIPAFAVPPNVGGRFSVLTPVGTLPAALVGIDTSELLAGARESRNRCGGGGLAHDPAGVFAVLQWRAHQRAAQGIHVMMPYSDSLRDVAAWFAQLWAESLGKVDSEGAHVGPTPVAALGATDQHSQLQLYMEGPADKTITFLIERGRRVDATIPGTVSTPAAARYLQGHTLGALLDAEQRATALALAGAGRPNMDVALDRVDARHVGALLMLVMHATIVAGELYRVNPLDQPGVEVGKRLAREALSEGETGTATPRWTV